MTEAATEERRVFFTTSMIHGRLTFPYAELSRTLTAPNKKRKLFSVKLLSVSSSNGSIGSKATKTVHHTMAVVKGFSTLCYADALSKLKMCDVAITQHKNSSMNAAKFAISQASQ